MNRSDLMNQFGLSVNQASTDLNRYIVLETRGAEASGVTAAADEAWHAHVTLETAPHPELPKNQKKVIALDYGTRGGKAKINFLRALPYYALKSLGLDTDPGAIKSQDQLNILLNVAEVTG